MFSQALPQNITKLSNATPLKESTDMDIYDAKHGKVRGHLVHFPMDFLCDEDLLPSFFKGEVEGVLKKELFI